MRRRTFLRAAAVALAGGAVGSRFLGNSTKAEEAFPVMKSDEDWKRALTPEQYRVMRRHGTEPAHSSPLDKEYGEGLYQCAACGQPVYSSQAKFDSGTGWPSFWEPLAGGVGTSTDYYLIMPRTEVHCSRCGGHLGHVFKDGPKPTGLRYCMNGVALTFVPREAGKATGSG